MKSDRVVFITLKDYDNLGIGYMAAVLTAQGFKKLVLDPRLRKSQILKTIRNFDPLLVGFSVIFLNHIDLFSQLASYLRRKGIKSHFTAGGHYASLKSGELFTLMPCLDSIVMFEGEYTLLELVKSIRDKTGWKNTQGIAYREDGNIVINPVRTVVKDLDLFPFPYRDPLREYAFRKKFATIIAGRGCLYNCSFCNTREFYRRASAPGKRIRKPEMVVSEMKFLFRKHDCSVFIFNDDDFPLKTANESIWVNRFCGEIRKAGLNRKIMWKINCRPDGVEEEKFALMKKNGLFLVFLGLEDGTNTGLNKLNKHLTVEENLKAINTLKSLDIGFDYGFMLFQPDTTYKTLAENLQFLKLICSDGYTPVTFLKLLPLYDTRNEKELRKSGRLIITGGRQDYNFLQTSMNHYYDFITEVFFEWMRSSDGLENRSKWARNYISVYKHYFDQEQAGHRFYLKFRKLISGSNIFLLDTMKELAMIFESGQYLEDKGRILDRYKKSIKTKHKNFRKSVNSTMAKFLSFAEGN